MFYIQRIILYTRRFIFYALLLIACASHAYAGKTFQQRIPKSLKDQDNSFLTVTVENDLFGAGTDENYTNGVRLTYFDDNANPPELVRSLGEAVPFFNVNSTTNVYYSLGHNLYTPRDITTGTPNAADRPYAAFVYGSIGYSTVTDDHIDDIEVTLGIVGPASLGAQTQDFVHDLIDSDDPAGWGNQLRNEPGVMLAYQRTWPEALSAEFDPFFVRVAPHAGLTLGNIYTYGAAGVTFQLVPSRHIWQAPPPRVRPAIPGSGYFSIPENEISWSLFAGFEGRAIGRNIFLDGNSFQQSASVDKRYGVMDANAGFTVSYGRAQIAYTLNWRSEEFHNQDDASIFGSVSLGYRF